ncbi:MAG: dihydroneopterin triphosphate diphosphatase, partial [Burkholderiaceae bacterium]
MKPTKIPISVLVVIHDGQGQVLLIERADKPGFWQSVTGSLDQESELPVQAARRELQEETGFVCPQQDWLDWQQTQRYEIFPHWRHRYA